MIQKDLTKACSGGKHSITAIGLNWKVATEIMAGKFFSAYNM